jgi:alpha-methylacyl-CoA racemase
VTGARSGPLAGVRVLELAGIGPGPHAAMMLADLGAEVVRIERPGGSSADPRDAVLRSRTVTTADLKNPQDVGMVRDLAAHADVLLEGNRPGVAERLGLGPADLQSVNPRLIYVRITGWGQDGPLAERAGHDINYISLTGALHAVGLEGQRPTVPLNFVGDYGGGSMFAVVGVLAALVERGRSGSGQVVDAAMVDGAAALIQQISSLWHLGRWSTRRGSNTLDSGAPFYDTYECADGGYMAVGAIEPQFYAELLHGLGIDAQTLPAQLDQDGWPQIRRTFEQVFRTRPRDEWADVFAATDACTTPVLDFDEAVAHPHMAARAVHTDVDGLPQARPAPRFERTPGAEPATSRTGVPLSTVLAAWEAASPTG